MKTTLLTLAVIALAVGLACAADTGELWAKHCSSCHAKDGSGSTTMGKKLDVKDYRDSKVQAELKDEKAAKTVKEGLTEKGKEKMKPFAGKLSDDEIKALIGHMRTFKK
jgi:cytochrome c553